MVLLDDLIAALPEDQREEIVQKLGEFELSPRLAAVLLGVSRNFVMKQMDKGLIPFKKTKTHRVVKFKDLMEYKRQSDIESMRALDELAKLDQELGLSY